MFDAVEQLAFGQLQLQQFRGQAGFLQHLAHQADQLALAQLMHRQVHRHPDRRQPVALPLARLPAGLAQDELTDRPDQPGFLGQADKVRRRHLAQGRMLPTHQRLGGVHPPSGQAQLGLVEDAQLPLFDGLAQLVLQLQALQGAGLQALGVELEVVPAQVLGVLHGDVRLAEQHWYFPRIVRQQADAHGRADHQLMLVDGHRHPQLAEQARRHPRQAGEIAVGVEQHGELIPGQTGDGVGFRQGIDQAPGHLLQQLVGDFMTEAVVEQFETVQVDVQQRQAAATLANLLMGLVQAFAEQRTVRQPRQFVVVGQVAHALFGFAAGRQIGEEADDMADMAPRIAHHIQLQPLRVQLAVLARLHQFALPAAVLLQGLVDGRIVTPGIATARQVDHIAPEHVFGQVTGHPAEGLVDRQQAVIGVKNHDAFAGRLEHRRGQLAQGFLFLVRADIATGADHAQHPTAGGALDRPAAVFDPDPVTIAMPHPVLDQVVLGAALQMFHQRALECRDILGVQARLEVAEHGRHVFRIKAEQLLELGVMHFVGLQVPVPQPEGAGLQRQGQARFAFAQGLVRRIQLQAALDHPAFQADLGVAQFLFGTATLLDFPRQFEIELFAAGVRLLQALDQRLVLETPQQAASDQPIDLQGHHTQRHQQDQPEPAPALLFLGPPPEQIDDGRQQAGQGKGQERRDAHGVGHAGGEGRGTDQAEDPGLLEKTVGGHQGDAGAGQGQAADRRTQQEGPTPDRLGLATGHRRIERRHLDHAQGHQRHQPHQPDADQQVALRAPEQPGADQTVQQHE